MARCAGSSGKELLLRVRSMRVGMMFRRFLGMVRCVHRVAVGNMRMVAGLLMLAFLVKFGRLAVMFGRMFMMLGGCFVMLGLGVAGHDVLPLMRRSRARTLPLLRAGGMTLP